RSQASTVPRREAFIGSTLSTRNTRSRTGAIASPTRDSDRPPPYISAVSTTVEPASMPARSAAISSPRRSGSSPMYLVHCRLAGSSSQPSRTTVGAQLVIGTRYVRGSAAVSWAHGTSAGVGHLQGLAHLVQGCGGDLVGALIAAGQHLI